MTVMEVMVNSSHCNGLSKAIGNKVMKKLERGNNVTNTGREEKGEKEEG